jgi:pimeloyl-ACP methyl ester carboxylesterase
METRTISVRDGMFTPTLLQGGTGEPLLYLHHSGGLQEAPFLDMLAETFTVYAPHHPGWGPSEGLEHIEDIVDMALYYHDVLDALGLESAHVVGHSIGGMIAAEVAALCSHRVRRLVLSNPVGFWRDEEPVLDFMAVPMNELLPKVVHDPESPKLREAWPPPEGPEAAMEALYFRMQAFASAGKFLWPIPDKGLKRRIHRIQAPTLILWGESDGLVSPVYAEDFRSGIKDSKVVILKEAGHMPMFEQPDEFVSLVSEFLAGS